VPPLPTIAVLRTEISFIRGCNGSTRESDWRVDMGFAEDVKEGLSSSSKFLLSRYFYDDAGDKLFQDIMNMPEYYLTDCEYEIFSTRGSDILKAFSDRSIPFDILEFGAGDGFKTKILLERLLESKADFNYIPIDISATVLDTLKEKLSADLPELRILPKNAEYFRALEQVQIESERPKLILFIGSSIGNFPEERIRLFLSELFEKLKRGDQFLLGYDLKKNPHIILNAYNDARGITKAFNLNILRRINRELDGHFDLESFDHYPFYDPETGLAKSYLVSLKKQTVEIGKLNRSFEFEMGETIHTEISRKFTTAQMERYFMDAGFELVEHFFDCKHYFVDTLIKKP
jgi:dimethylhistidine N-methyltransferase